MSNSFTPSSPKELALLSSRAQAEGSSPKGEDIVAIFAICFRSLSFLSRVNDNFFVEMSEKETDKLLSVFIKFLKLKSDEIAQHEGHVAQYCLAELISQIKKILEVVALYRHLKLLDSPTSLLLERNLLLLEKYALESTPAVEVKKPAREQAPAKQAKTAKKEIAPTGEPASPTQLNGVHKQILDMIKGRDRVLNTDVFTHFPGISRRTLKRRLSEMIQTHSITRHSEGKRVYYSAATA